MALDIDRFKARLVERRDELESVADSGRQAAQTVELDQTRVGRLSRMDALQAQAMSLEAIRRRDIELAGIRGALQRIEQGEYGDCLECGEQIAQARLEIDPAGTLCIRCAQDLEASRN